MTSQLIYKCDIKIFTDLYLFVLLKNNVNNVDPQSMPIWTPLIGLPIIFHVSVFVCYTQK